MGKVVRHLGRHLGAQLGAVLVLAISTFAVASGPAAALEEAAGEKEELKACEKRICEIIVKQEATGADLACKLSKTWNKAKIQEGIEKKRLSWSFGNARCAIDVGMKREDIVAAMTKPDHAINMELQTVKCEVEREKEVTEVSVTLAPKLTFKGGKADKAWLNVKQIDAPAVIKGALWSAAQIENNLGVFHGDMISGINDFIGQKCAKAMAN